MNVRRRVRSALSGRFVPLRQATTDPAGTVVERIDVDEAATVRAAIAEVADRLAAAADESSDGHVRAEPWIRELRVLAHPPYGVKR